MRLLLIDTSGASGSIALAETNGSPAIVGVATLPGRTASERLVPAVKDLLADQNAGMHSLGVIAVVHGPGSFTGVRVGVSAAKGLCEALGVPLIAISRLAVLADVAASSSGASADEIDATGVGHVHALLDAGRGEFYYGEYVDGVCLREALLTRDEVLSAIGVDVHAGTVVACEAGVAAALAPLPVQVVSEPGAADALRLALRRIELGEFDDVAAVDANYVRRTDAEIFAKPRPAVPAVSLPEDATEATETRSR
jgi:tRNA threonylcarbamoyladenosine biosynthesis protein TsaB